MEALDVKKAMAIFIAMDPNKAADVLTGSYQSLQSSKLWQTAQTLCDRAASVAPSTDIAATKGATQHMSLLCCSHGLLD